MRKLRVAFVCHRFPPGTIGGACIYTFGIARGLQEAGHESFLICAGDISDPSLGRDQIRVEDELVGDLPVRRLHLNWQRSSDPYGALWVSNPAVAGSVKEYLTATRPDLVHVTSCYWLSAAVIGAAKELGLPVVLTLTGKWFICPVGTLLRWDSTICEGRKDGLTCLRCQFGRTKTYQVLNSLPEGMGSSIAGIASRIPHLSRAIGSLNIIDAVERRNPYLQDVLSKVDVVISPSRCHQDVFASSGIIEADRIHYSPHGRDVHLAEEGQAKTASRKIRFGFTGQPLPHKGVRTLMTAWRRFAPGMQAELQIWGDIDADPVFGREIREMAGGDPSISLRGEFSHSEIGKILQQLDAVVVPSEFLENSPGTIAEAFAAKTPVIGSDVAGVAEHIESEVNGLLFRRRDADDLAHQFRRITEEADILHTLRRGIKPVRTVADQVIELEAIYRRLKGESVLYEDLALGVTL